MPSASRKIMRLALVAICSSLLLGAAAGCSTTQEKAAHAKARAEHVLDARAQRQKKAGGKSKGDNSAQGSKKKGGSNE